MGLFNTEKCPICDKDTNALKKTMFKCNGKHICRDCFNIILNKGINVIEIKKYTQSALKNIVNGNKNNAQINYINQNNMYNFKNSIVNIQEIKLNIDNIERIKNKFIAFDIETTGLNNYQDRIIEIGAAYFENGIAVAKFNSLINCGLNISPEVSRINHITNEMIYSAPSENKVYDEFLEFLKNAMSNEIVICAHNASFDIGFLKSTFTRLGYDCNIKYIDTLKMSRSNIYDIDNHKLGTLADYFDLVNDNAHRAYNDAEVCGEILLKLLPYYENKFQKLEMKKNKQIFSDVELLTCSYIQNEILKNDNEIEYLRFEKKSGGYISCKAMYEFLLFKVSNSGIYFIVNKKYSDSLDLVKDNATLSEGGIEYKRVYINSIEDISCFSSYIVDEYIKAYKFLVDYVDNKEYKLERVNETISPLYKIDLNVMTDYIQRINELEIPKIIVKCAENINRKQIKINPKNTRINIKKIKKIEYDSFDNDDEYYKENEKNTNLCFESDEKLKQKDYTEAISILDKVRENGYLTGDLYRRYSSIYHSIKDYDNEIDILEEAIPIMKKNNEYIIDIKTKLQNAINLKYKLDNTERIKEELEKEKERERAIKKAQEVELRKIANEKRKEEQGPVAGRIVIQMDDNENVIQEFISIAEAVRVTGVNSKGIRDAANGVQKHAGGFVWKFKDKM